MADNETPMGDDRTPGEDQKNQDGGPTLSQAGAMPGGNDTGWKTANPKPDATKPETMPNA